MPWLLRMTLLVALLMLPAVLYLIWRYRYSSRILLPESSGWSYILSTVIGSFYLFPAAALACFYIVGDIDILKFPKLLTYWFWFGLVFVFQLTTWVLIAEGLQLIASFVSDQRQTIKRLFAQGLFVLFVVIFCFTGWKTYRDTTQIEVNNVTLPVENIPEKMNGFRIVHITDIQGDEYTGRREIASYVDKINEQQPDIVVFTGDLISYGTDFIKSSAEEFGQTTARLGTYAVVGDHDYWAGTENVEKALQQENIPLLKDENYTIEVDSSISVLMTGVTEVYSKSSSPAIVDSLTKTAGEATLKILASHQIKDHLIQSSKNNNYDMILAGHTHGGQIHVPFLGMRFSAAGRETPYVGGLYQEENLPIHVNNGLGFTLAPIRYDAPPEVTVIELSSE